MSSTSIVGFARSLLRSRYTGNILPPSFGNVIRQVEEGYAVQDELIRQSMCSSANLGKLVGWKVGATSEAAVRSIGYGPFYGPLFESAMMNNRPICLSALGKFKAVEAEIGFLINKDFPQLANGCEYMPEDVWSHVEAVCPSVEIAAGRVQGSLSPAVLIADCAMNGSVIKGSKLYLPQDFKNGLAGVADISATLEVNGCVVGAAAASEVLQNPVNSLTWLVNELNKCGKMLRGGDFVMSGAMLVYNKVVPGDKIVCKFHV